MAVAALSLFVVYLATGFVLRGWLQWRDTGDAGFRGISGPAWSARWWAGVLFVVALVAGLAGPVVALLGLEPIPVLAATWVQGAGTVLTVLGIALTLYAQGDMGRSWRVGVDDSETTELVTSGVFALARNPVFTAMAVTGAGLMLMVPNLVALTGFLLLLAALQLQVRVVEEPYLRSTHGPAYQLYAATTGRFFPGLGLTDPMRHEAATSTPTGGDD